MTNKRKEQLNKEIPRTMQLTFCAGYRNRNALNDKINSNMRARAKRRNSLRSCDQTLMALCKPVRIVQRIKNKEKQKKNDTAKFVHEF